MKASILYVVLLILTCQAQPSHADSQGGEDVKLYVAVISRFPPPKGKYYLVDNEYAVPRDVDPRITEYLQKAPKELIERLANLNATQSGNFPALPEKPIYRILTDSEKKRLNWGKLEAEEAVQVNHPNAYGLLHFSKPIFSSDSAKSVIYRAFYIGDHGDGTVFYLEKAKGRWQFIEGMDVWRASW